MTLRPATPEDRDAVLALGVAEETAWFGKPDSTVEEVEEWIEDEGGIELGVVALDGEGQIRGFASPGRHESMFMADPALTDPVADELLPWLRRQREQLELMTFGGDAARVQALARHGLRHLRSAFSLYRPIDAGPLPSSQFPEGVEVAPYRWGENDHAVHRLIYVDAAFAAIAGHAERDLEDWRKHERACPLVFVASRGDRYVGWLAGRLLEDGRGEVATIAVAAEERGRGVGRALLLHGLGELRRAGAGELTLGVEGENESALALYRSVGLQVKREWRVYSTRTASGDDQALTAASRSPAYT